MSGLGWRAVFFVNLPVIAITTPLPTGSPSTLRRGWCRVVIGHFR
jgi:hypothetical protein